MKIDEIDIKILSELQKDSRLSIRELSKRVNLSAPSVTERVRRLEDNGVIEGYTVRINKKLIGFPIECIIIVTIRNGVFKKFKEYITNHPRSDFCYTIAGDASYIAKLSVKTLAELEIIVEEISCFAITTSLIVFSQVTINEDISKFFDK